MAKPLRSQLNQIRAWVRQGRTDAWIAHQLDVSTSELREFRRRHELDVEEESGEADLRDEIEAEIEAATREEEEEAAAREEEEAAAAREEEEAAAAREAEEAAALREEEAAAEEDEEAETLAAGEPADGGRAAEEADEEDEEEERPRRRRRRRRGGRGRRARKALQATFDHGEDEGYGLWLDPAVKDDPVYGEHWAGTRRIEVTIEPDQIVIRRSDSD